MLTQKQYNLLMFINKVNRETGQCPSFDEMKEAIALIDGHAEVELSGNFTLENIGRIRGIGANFVSCGALTHSAPILDLSLKHLKKTGD